MLDVEARLTGIRQSMRVLDRNGLHLGHVRDVSGLSILVQELYGRRVFWIPAAEVGEVVRDEVRLTTARSVVERATEAIHP